MTLLGDAIHNMMPMGGMGANTALRDADTLTHCLINAAAGRLSITEKCQSLRRGNESVCERRNQVVNFQRDQRV